MRFRSSAILLLCFLAGACADPQSFEELDPDITSTKRDGDVLIISATQSLVSEGLAASQLGMLIGDIAQGVQSDFPGTGNDVKDVRLQLSNTTLDRLGNEGEVEVATFMIAMSDLRSANLENLSGSMWLDLVDSASLGQGAGYLINHCSDPENFQLDRIFCGALAENLVAP